MSERPTTSLAASFEISADLTENLASASLDYLAKIRTPATEDTIPSALGVVFDAYQLGLIALAEQGKTPNSWKSVLKEGYARRKQIIDDFRSLYNGIKTGDPSLYGINLRSTLDLDLALDPNQLQQAIAENEHPDFSLLPHMHAVVSHEKQARQIINDISLTTLSNATGVPVDELFTTNPDPRPLKELPNQARIIRGLVTCAILKHYGKLSELDSPTFLSDQAIAHLLDIVAKTDGRTQKMSTLAQYVRNLFGFEESQLEWRIIASYINQIYNRVKLWQKSSASHQSNATPGYWANFQKIFVILPLNPATTLERYGFTTEDYPQKRREGLAHLWQHAVIMDGYAIPSMQDLQTGISILRSEKLRINYEAFPQNLAVLYARLERAIYAWTQYTQIQKHNPNRIANFKTRLASLPKPDNIKLSRLLENEKIYHGLVIRIEKANKALGRLRKLRAELLASPTPDDPDFARIYMQNTLRTKLVECEESIEFHRQELDKPRVIDFPNRVTKNPIAWSNMDERELTNALGRWTEFRDALISDKPIPDIYTRRDTELRVYISSLLPRKLAHARKTRKLRDLRTLAEPRVLPTPSDLLILRNLLVDETLGRIHVLTTLISNIRKKDRLESEIAFAQKSSYKVDRREIEKYNERYTELQMLVVPVHITAHPERHERDLASCRVLLGEYHALHETSFQIPVSRDALPQAIKKAAKKLKNFPKTREKILEIGEKLVRQKDNPLLPFERSKPVALGAFMKALEWRVRLVTNLIDISDRPDSAKSQRKKVEQSTTQLQDYKQAVYYTRQLTLFQKGLDTNRVNLINRMRVLGLAIPASDYE